MSIFCNTICRGFRSTRGQNHRFPIDFDGHRYNSAALLYTFDCSIIILSLCDGGHVIKWQMDLDSAGSNLVRGCCVPTPSQHTIPLGLVNEYQRKLWSKPAYHTID